MKLQNIKEFLEFKPGYKKEGAKRLKRHLEAKGFKPSLENCRVALREVRRGSSNSTYNGFSKKTKDTEDLLSKVRDLAKNLGYNLEAETKPLINTNLDDLIVKTPSISKQVGMHIVLGCWHVPFHNKTLHKGVRKLIEDYKSEIKGFHLIGDFLDLNALSSHDRGKFTSIPGLTLSQEYKAGNIALDQLTENLESNCWKTYLYGNHEDRYNRWMRDMNNAKTPLISPKESLKLNERGFQTKTSWSQDYFKLGKYLDIFHGIYFSIHSAKAHMDKLRGSCMYAHTHRIQQYIEGNTGSFNIGAGADFSSPAFGYASRAMKSQWQNGFAVVMIDEDGSYHTTQVICQNGRFYFGGKKY